MTTRELRKLVPWLESWHCREHTISTDGLRQLLDCVNRLEKETQTVKELRRQLDEAREIATKYEDRYFEERDRRVQVYAAKRAPDRTCEIPRCHTCDLRQRR